MTVPQWGKFPLELDEVQSDQQRDLEMHPYLDSEAIPYARSTQPCQSQSTVNDLPQAT
jgi:hypothetical protein